MEHWYKPNDKHSVVCYLHEGHVLFHRFQVVCVAFKVIYAYSVQF